MTGFSPKNLKVFNKILLLIFTIIIPFILVIQFFMLPDIRTELLENKKSELTHILETAYNIYKAELKSVNNDSTLQVAKEKVFEQFSRMRYDGDNYLFVIDAEGIVYVHPANKSLIGQSLWDYKDPNDKYLFREMVNVATAQGEGFVDYLWEKPGSPEPVAKISYAKLLEEWDLVLASGLYIDDIDNNIWNLEKNVYTAIVIVVILVVLLGIFLGRTIANPIKILDEAAEKVANGDTSIKIDINSEDETGKLAKSFNKMVESLNASFNDVRLKSDAAERAAADAEEAQAQAEEQRAYLAESIHKMLTEMNRLSAGDLTTKLKVDKEDEIGQLFSGYNITVEKIRELIQEITGAVEAAASASTQISSSTEEMAAGMQEQSSQTSEVAAAVEQMTQTIVQSSRNASNAASSAELTSNKAKEGASKLRENKEGIIKISNSSQKTGRIISNLASRTDQIGEIAQVIDDIADQTNLLALNAAIEAARAGEQGRGFAVVADEVRKLAERTTKATKEIAETIHAIQDEAQEAKISMDDATQAVNDGLKLTSETEGVFQTILESAENLLQEITQVAAASEEQSSGAEQISKNIEGINSIAQQSASSVQQVARATEDLNMLTEKLLNLINRFDTGNNSYQSKNLAQTKSGKLLK